MLRTVFRRPRGHHGHHTPPPVQHPVEVLAPRGDGLDPKPKRPTKPDVRPGTRSCVRPDVPPDLPPATFSRPSRATLQRVLDGLRDLPVEQPATVERPAAGEQPATLERPPAAERPVAERLETGDRPATALKPTAKATSSAWMVPGIRGRHALASGTRLRSVGYPTGGTDHDYASLMRQIGRITGTRTNYERTGAWNRPFGR